ncbi:MAG: helix-turn-helix domain-containing protein [Proteobacteria bacterium]|nr:helix-turn-helix domain-containing protein [Pseudomonadota bacterium]MBU1450888.1 helix-turn-helix domain-containing protein [Pseudomonadota bacterium]MBU2468707.1 helix-turn-helix domain-containing protein [Pseudomonadota bacterium]MBU2517187.1 helix-turn-helix domain-containing protein [Pseudomonadota bacterium]
MLESRINNLHQNARATVYSRAPTVDRVREGRNVSQVAEELGVSRRTVSQAADPLWARRPGGAAQSATALENREQRPCQQQLAFGLLAALFAHRL